MASSHQRYLDGLKKMADAGIAVAVPAALHFCLEHKQPAPEWLLAASTDLFCELLKAERPRRRGRAATHIARHRQDKIDYDRWGTVQWQRDSQKDLLEQVNRIREEPDGYPADYREDRERLQQWLGTTLDRAFRCAAAVLEGTEAFGSPEAIKRSYFKVEHNLGDPNEAVRYAYIEPMFLHERLGIKWEPFVRPGRKIEPLYKLAV